MTRTTVLARRVLVLLSRALSDIGYSVGQSQKKRNKSNFYVKYKHKPSSTIPYLPTVSTFTSIFHVLTNPNLNRMTSNPQPRQ